MLILDQLIASRASKCRALICLAGAIFSGNAYATTYSAVNDFSLAGNPNGVWSYLYGGTLLGTEEHVTTGNSTGLDIWWSAKPVPDSADVGRNFTNSAVTVSGTIVVPTNYLLLDTESYSNVDVRFTAVSAATYTITGNFMGIDIYERSHPVEIIDNGVVIFAGTIAGYGQNDAFNLTRSLNAGDVLDFESLTGATYTYLSTGLAVTIASGTPEPSACGLILAGLSLIGVASWRKGGGFQLRTGVRTLVDSAD